MRGLKRYYRLIFLFLIITSLIFPSLLAHVPNVSEGNESLETATHIHDPTKSWAIYSELHEGREAQYYELELEEGERLKTNLYIPDKNGFVPSIVVMGPDIDEHDDIPDFIETVEGSGHKLIEGELEEPEYEPFTPASYYYLAEYDVTVNESGSYYIAVFDEESGGKYGLAIGAEERYGLIEWIRVPIDVVQVHRWEGQPWITIFAPLIIVLIGGFSLIYWKDKKEDLIDNYRGWLAVTAGFLYIGTGGMTIMQMTIASMKANPGASIILTITFSVLPILLGIAIIKKGLKIEERMTRDKRITLLIYGALGFFVWAGLIVGPILTILDSVLPSKR